MSMICRWVHADDGALVMEWTRVEGTAARRGTGDAEAADAFEVFDHTADALIPAGVWKSLPGHLTGTGQPDRPAGAHVTDRSRTRETPRDSRPDHHRSTSAGALGKTDERDPTVRVEGAGRAIPG